MKPVPPTQAHLNIQAFRDGVLIADDGTLAYVLEIKPVDLSMLEAAQAAWIKEQFARFISSVRFPHAIQFVIGNYPQNLSAYLDRLHNLAQTAARAADAAASSTGAFSGEAQAPVSAAQAFEAVSQSPAAGAGPSTPMPNAARMAERLLSMQRFIEESLERVRPIESRYFAVVFHNPLVLRNSRRLSAEAFARGKQNLDQLLARVTAGLSQATLDFRRLDEYEVAEVIHWFYHQTGSPLAGRQSPRLRLLPSLASFGSERRPDAVPAAIVEQTP